MHESGMTNRGERAVSRQTHTMSLSSFPPTEFARCALMEWLMSNLGAMMSLSIRSVSKMCSEI